MRTRYPQRILFTDIDAVTGNNHTMYIEHQAMKGYIHAYDFLGSWQQATLVATDPPIGFGLNSSTGWDLWADQDKGFVKGSDSALYTSLVSGGNSYSVTAREAWSRPQKRTAQWREQL